MNVRMQKTALIALLFLCTFFLPQPSIHAAQHGKFQNRLPSALAERISAALQYGTAEEQIGTFGGWTFWMGWDGTFSETYVPSAETYCWLVFFAPEGVFVALQKAESVYSAVDMNAGFDYFYGVLQSPDGDVITRQYLNSLLGVSLSVNIFDTSMAGVGPLSQVSMAFTSGQTLFRQGNVDTLERGVQYSAGLLASFNLVPFSLPFGVKLDSTSEMTTGFYPIILWDIPASDGDNPVDLIVDELQDLSAQTGSDFPDYYETEIADMMIPFMQGLPSDASFDDFLAGRSSTIDDLIRDTETWLSTNDTENLPAALYPRISPAKQFENMKPVKAITDACFELGYEHGYRSKDRDDTIYADCINTIQCTPRQPCTVSVTGDEIAGLVEGSQPADFEGIWIGFDTVADAFIMAEEEITWATIENNTAEYTFTTNTDAPFFMGVQVWPDPVTDDKTIELCRRKIVFDEGFEITDGIGKKGDNSTCPAEKVLTADSSEKTLTLLRSFRDQRLSTTPQGRNLIRLYYRHGRDIWQVLEKNLALKDRCRTLIAESAPFIASLLHDKDTGLPAELSGEIIKFLSCFEAAAPGQLSGLLQEIRRYLQVKSEG